LNIKRALPLNQPVVIEFTPERNGDIAFACGMDMLKGVVVVD
jgi:plastocyanin domain-containing protein